MVFLSIEAYKSMTLLLPTCLIFCFCFCFSLGPPPIESCFVYYKTVIAPDSSILSLICSWSANYGSRWKSWSSLGSKHGAISLASFFIVVEDLKRSAGRVSVAPSKIAVCVQRTTRDGERKRTNFELESARKLHSMVAPVVLAIHTSASRVGLNSRHYGRSTKGSSRSLALPFANSSLYRWPA